ncbi:uncharacterized protein DUF202 [Stackebrandtia albiflava]|uniref:Uncharacterized protein DUF202 n=1 Tax=Stackebrandtia albiflava TaxID=406432 RepID=A0A562ULB8_9ACTN|nr:DUF202 domain-containing protein [Stackebrandtia albiflava]TWJ06405.1 uncharacterized protein DUF202 [Stackebrandtia albiflava]
MSRDPGAQPERTRLAWRRTLLAATVLVLLAARGAVMPPLVPADLLVVGGLALVWLGMLAGAHRRIQAFASPRPVRMGLPTAWLATGSVVGLAVLGFVTLW